jgi:hypothetical protein
VAVRPPGPDRPLLIVLDQFEETFTQCHDEDDRRAFIAALHAAATTPLGPQRIPAARVALVVRADYETRCGSYPQLADAAQHRYLLLPMGEGQLRLAITEPAEVVESSVDPALTDLLVGQVQARAREISPDGLRVGAAAGPEVLPLLSYALDQAWRQRVGDTLTLADYERTGGIGESIAKSAEEAFSGLTVDQQTAAQRMFIRLTVTGSDGTVSAARVTRTTVAAGIPEDDATAVLEAFSGPERGSSRWARNGRRSATRRYSSPGSGSSTGLTATWTTGSATGGWPPTRAPGRTTGKPRRTCTRRGDWPRSRSPRSAGRRHRNDTRSMC